MRVDIPECARCCFCGPLRHGILIFGYLSLGLTFTFLGFEIIFFSVILQYPLYEMMHSSTDYIYRGVFLFSQVWLMFIIYILDIIFNVILLVGAHMKHPTLIRVYYYYSITTCLAAFLCYVVMHDYSQDWRSMYECVFLFALAFSGLVLHVYLMFLIRSELKKLSVKTQRETQMYYVNHECEVYIEEPPYHEQRRNPII